MPQFDMVLIDDSAPEAAGAALHAAGRPWREGGGNETYRCGACKTKLLVNVAHKDAHGAIARCGKCGRVNIEPHHAHHHH